MIDEIIKNDLKRVSQMESDDVMDLLDLDGEDSAEVRSNLGKKEITRKTEFGGLSRKSARVVKGGSAW
jgi:hypothetical protein